MIKIGDFAKLANVTIKTLHHYDGLGLIKPVHVDRYSGYRYYDLDQLSLLNRILALKDLGFSLEQVYQLIHEDISTQEMRGMLRMKQYELFERVAEEQTRLSRVEARLKQLESEAGFPAYEIAVKSIPEMMVLTLAQMYSDYNAFTGQRDRLMSQLTDQLHVAKLKPTGPFLTLMDRLPREDSPMSLEIGIPVQLRKGQHAGDWLGSPVEVIQLPSEEWMASVIHSGDVDTIPNTYKHMYRWSFQHAYQIAGFCREIYLADPYIPDGSAVKPNLIEVQCPVSRVPVPISLRSQEKEQTMEPKFINKPAFKVIGLSYVGKNENQEIAQMWGQFNQGEGDGTIKTIDPSQAYGLCFGEIDHPDPAYFEYVCGIEVANDEEIPDGMVYREVPAYKYAVFTHHGALDNLSETYKYIYETWLPASGHELDGKFDMEVYDQDFIMSSPESKLYIYVAIK